MIYAFLAASLVLSVIVFLQNRLIKEMLAERKEYAEERYKLIQQIESHEDRLIEEQQKYHNLQANIKCLVR